MPWGHHVGAHLGRNILPLNLVVFGITAGGYAISLVSGQVAGIHLLGSRYIFLSAADHFKDDLRKIVAHEVTHVIFGTKAHLQNAVAALRGLESRAGGALDIIEASRARSRTWMDGIPLDQIETRLRQMSRWRMAQEREDARGPWAFARAVFELLFVFNSLLEPRWTYGYGTRLGDVILACSDGDFPTAYRIIVAMGHGASLAEAVTSVQATLPSAANPEPGQPAGLEEAVQAWAQAAVTPARATPRPSLLIFDALETFSAIPLVARAGLSFLVLAQSHAEAEAVETLLTSLGFPTGSYGLWRLDQLQVEALEAAFALIEERFGQEYTVMPIKPDSTAGRLRPTADPLGWSRKDDQGASRRTGGGSRARGARGPTQIVA